MTPEQRLERIAAFLAAADLFSDLAPPIALAAGADYPAEGERLVRELVSQTLS